MDPSAPAETSAARVAVRMERRALLIRDKSPEAMFVLDESAFRRPVGGSAVMTAQIDHLIAMAQTPSVQVRVMPFESVTPIALAGGFILLSFPKDPDLMYTETGSVSQFIEDRAIVFKAGVHFTSVVSEALNRAESIDFMRLMREEYREST